MVNRSARVSSAGHGGQILLSERALRGFDPQPDYILLDLGEHRLKGLEWPEHVWQLSAKELASRQFPPIKTLDVIKTNLPRRPSSFVGRENELRQLTEFFQDSNNIAVTLTGPGGTGKTRLSQRWAGEQLADFPAGVWFADLTEARSVPGICNCVGDALGVPMTQQDPVEQIGYAINGRCTNASGPILVILDNFEQVVDHAGATVARWMSMAPKARFLISSRVPLRIEGEKEFPLEPLATPARKQTEKVGKATRRMTRKLESYASLRLFAQRAREVNPKFEMNEENVEAVAQICVKLDGIPLAIELAASRSKLLTPQKILDRMGQRFDLLKSGRRDVTERQATLRGAIDWSWELLTDYERSACAQLSVFRGGFFLAGAEDVVDLSAFKNAPLAMDVVESLREKSLLKSEEVKGLSGETRFNMYESIREYASEKLKELGLLEKTQERWRKWLLDYARGWWEKRRGRESTESTRRLDLETEGLIRIAQDMSMDPEQSGWAAVFIAPTLNRKGPITVAEPMLVKCLERLGFQLPDFDAPEQPQPSA